MKTTLQKANASKKVSTDIAVPASPATRAALRLAAKELGQPMKLVASLALEHAAEMLKDGRLKFTPNTGVATVPVMLPAKLASHIASVVMLEGDEPEHIRNLAHDLF